MKLFNSKDSSILKSNLITSGLYFYLYNELSTLTIKKTSATTQSVANTAKRVIVIVGSALAFGESLEAMKMLGCFICIGGVFAYSLVPRRSSNTPALSPYHHIGFNTQACDLLTRARSPVGRSSRGAAPKPCCATGQKGGPDRCDLWGACSRRGVSAG